MKIKGTELVAKWQKAKDVVNNINRLGEIGGILRGKGYDVVLDGFSCCTFLEKGSKLMFFADSCDSSWHLVQGVYLNDERIDLHEIKPDAEYEISKRLSVAEMYDQGLLDCERFAMCNTDRIVGYFDSFNNADACARNMCKKLIDSRFEDKSLTRYYETSVHNDAQRACEAGAIRFYPWYNYQGHEHYISIIPWKN